MTNFILFSLFRLTCLLILSFEHLWASNFLITFLSIHVIFKRVLYITFVCQRSEWLLFIANSAIFFSYIIARTGQFSMRWWWGSLCIRTAHLVGFFFYSASSQKQQFADRHVTPLGYRINDYPDSEPTSLCSFSLMPHD